MAIIHCPECGKEVSDRAKQCVHCGVSIFVCPECGQVSAGESKCPNCGYSAVPAKQTDAKVNDTADKEGVQTPKNVYERWKAIDPQAKKWDKTISTISYFLWGLEIVLVVVWFFQVLQQYLNIDLESILTLAVNHKANLRQTDTYVTIIIILDIVTCAVDSSKGLVSYFACAKWIRRSKVEIGGEISLLLAKKKEMSEKKKNKKDEDEEEEEGTIKKIIDETNEEIDVENLESTFFLAVDPNKSAFFLMTKIIPQLFICAFSIFVTVCLKNNAVSFMNGVCSGHFVDDGNGVLTFTREFSFDWLTLAIGGVIGIALVVASFLICDFVRKKKINATLQKVQNAKTK